MLFDSIRSTPRGPSAVWIYFGDFSALLPLLQPKNTNTNKRNPERTKTMSRFNTCTRRDGHSITIFPKECFKIPPHFFTRRASQIRVSPGEKINHRVDVVLYGEKMEYPLTWDGSFGFPFYLRKSNYAHTHTHRCTLTSRKKNQSLDVGLFFHDIFLSSHALSRPCK